MKKRASSDKEQRQKNSFGVVLESIDSKMDMVVEGQHGLARQIDKNQEEVGEFRKEVNYKFDVVFDELRLIRNDLKEKVGRDEFIALEKRLSYVEKKLSHSAK